MPKKILPIPGTSKKMIIEKDESGALISVKDEDGKPAKTAKIEELKIKCRDIEAAIIDAPDDMTFVTKHNPTCRWYFINGQWYWICS